MIEPVGRVTLERLDASLPVGSHLRFVQPSERRVALPDSLRGLPRGLSAGHRLARVGLVGRLLDALIRIGNIFRPTVPWRTGRAAAAKAHRIFAASEPCCYGRVFEAAGWTALHYSFFYPMNDWRSNFRGVNDHEADWETVIVYLDSSNQEPAWLAYAAHDHSGDDLRRHWDDPEVERIAERPVVYVGGGSHASYFSAGEFVTTVHVASLGPFLAIQRFFRRLVGLDPAVDGFDIPYVDQALGTGLEFGPDGEHDLALHLLDESEPWVGDFRGLWGVDVDDPAEGERAPAGPKFERSGDIRRVWADPIGWAGLTKVIPPSQSSSNQTLIDAEIERIDGELDYLIRRARLLGLSGGDESATDELRRVEEGVTELRLQRRRLAKLDTTPAANNGALATRAHLTRPAEPMGDLSTRRARLLGFWAMISAPVMFAIVGALIVGWWGWELLSIGLLAGLAFEALTKRRFVRFVAVYLLLLILIAVIAGGLYAARTGANEVLGGLLIGLAGVTLVANVIERFRD